MNKKIFIPIMVVLIVIFSVIIILNITKNSTTMNLIVVNVNKNSLETVDFNNSLYVVSLKDKDMSQFKRGQEIKVYYNGMVNAMYPAGITANKVTIVNENSGFEISKDALRHFSYSQDNISFIIDSLTNKNISFRIVDLNEIPLEYGNEFEFKISKRNLENVKYNENIEVNQNNVTPAVTTNTYSATSSYNPGTSVSKNEWEEIEIVGSEELKKCKWDNIQSESKLFINGNVAWTEVYGVLSDGEYKMEITRISSQNDSFFKNISINFSVDNFGKVTYDKPVLGF